MRKSDDIILLAMNGYLRFLLKISWIALFWGGVTHFSFGQSNPAELSPVEYVSVNFENATPLFGEFNPDGSVLDTLYSSLPQWEARKEAVRRHILQQADLSPFPQKNPLNPKFNKSHLAIDNIVL